VPTFFVVLALDRFDDVKRQVGYPRAMRLLDQLGEDVALHLPDAERIRANRATVEFTLRCADAGAAEVVLRELVEALRGDIAVRGRTLPRSVTAAALPCHWSSASERVVEEAELALRQALRRRVAVLVSDRVVDDGDDQQLLDDLHAALLHGHGLALHYQPKLRTRTGALAGAEALLRWTDPVRGPVSPARVIAAAERGSDIGRLTEWVVDRAVADQVRLRAAGVDLHTHLNMSAPLVADPAFVSLLLDRLAPAEGSIGLEITETAMLEDPEGTLANLQRLSDAGIRLAIDDYGSGYSSLAYLQQLPVQELKIDRVFVSRLSSGARDPLLVRSTIDLAHALEMEVTAEGVETAAVLALLQVMGCDIAQGYFLSMPLPLDKLVDYVRRVGEGLRPARPASLRERIAERREKRERPA